MKHKRDYSRGGCRECKRRKIKCDEAKPHCVHCARLNKECSYPGVGEKVPRVSRRELQETSTGKASQKLFQFQVYSGPKERKRRNRTSSVQKVGNRNPTTSDLDQYSKPAAMAETSSNDSIAAASESKLANTTVVDYDSLEKKRIMLDSPSEPAMDEPTPSVELISSLNGSLAGSLAGSLDQANPIDPISLPLHLDMFQLDDLDSLALDLNNIVTDIIDAVPGPGVVPSSTRTFSFHQPPPSPSPSPTDIPRHVSFDYIKVHSGYEKLYLEDFYHGFAMRVLPFGSYDTVEQRYANPIRDTILQYASREPFLLAAVLAQGAKTAYDKNRLQHDHDEYKSYLSTSLTLLGPALSRNRDKEVRNDLTSNIECILLTVLLLTSANASTTMQNWRPHLKGAKEIILKATNGKIRSSKTLILCKAWFIDFEVLAGISSAQGGTLKSDFELDSILSFTDYETQVLIEFGMIQPNGFNIMFGYNNKCMVLFRELIKVINRLREGCVMDDSMEYLSLLSGFFDQYGVSYVDRNCIISDTAANGMPPGSPKNLNGQLIDTIETSNSPLKISWMDLAQQSYTLAALVTIFTKVMRQPYNVPHVQDLIARLVSLISWLEHCPGVPRQSIEQSLSMIQWPMLIAAANCIEEHQKYLLIKFFRVSVECGSGSAEIALRNILKLWEQRENGLKEDDEQIDIVPY